MSATDDPVSATWPGAGTRYWHRAQYGERDPVATRIAEHSTKVCLGTLTAACLVRSPGFCCQTKDAAERLHWLSKKTSHIWSSSSNVIKVFLMRVCEEVLTRCGNVRSSYDLHWLCISMERRIYYRSNLVPPLTCIFDCAFAL
jgi:hypothetical protein